MLPLPRLCVVFAVLFTHFRRSPTREQVEITVTNDNDNAPVFESTAANYFINESAAVGHVVEHVSARDADVGDRVTYAMYGDNSEHFEIDSDTGLIQISPLGVDYEEISEYYLIGETFDFLTSKVSYNFGTLRLLKKFY